MSGGLAFTPVPRREPEPSTRARARRRDVGDPGFALICAGTVSLAAYSAVVGNLLMLLVACVTPLLIWLFGQPMILLILLGASIPDLQSLTSGQGAGFNISISDLLLLVLGAAILLEATATRSVPAVRALRPVAFPVLQYGAFMVALLVFHLGIGGFAKTGQRFELVLLPLVVGAYAALTQRYVLVLKAYVASASVVALMWPLDNLGMQKNPVGQMIANAILLLVGVRALRRLLPCLLLLVPGLLLTQSRGAIIATIIGLAVIVSLQRGHARPVVARVLMASVVAVGVLLLLPSSYEARISTLSAGLNSPAAYALHVRQSYLHDAERIISSHPLVGIGVGNYLAGDAWAGTATTDPHNVILLQAAEGGYAFAVSFVVLVAGVFVALRRMREVDLAAAAAGVFLATVAHGLIDVYWVRGTPVLAWLLVGMACGQLARRNRSAVG